MNETYERILSSRYLPRSLGAGLIIAINWTFQSMLYMDRTERIFKLLTDVAFFLLFTVAFLQVLPLVPAIAVSIVLAHTLNWMVNGHIFALLKTFGGVKTDPERFATYIRLLRERIAEEESILAASTYGSLARRELKETSDLDVRLIRRSGWIFGLKACLFVMGERTRALLDRFPLDVYLIDDTRDLEKLRSDEFPIILSDPERVLEEYYRHDQREMVVWSDDQRSA
jgi:predicted nucleotidyltransferase